MTVRVKICGVRTPEDALAAVAAGADAIGVNAVPGSPRHASAELARELLQAVRVTGVFTVGVFANPDMDTLVQWVSSAPVQAIQLHGDEPADWGSTLRARLALPLWKAYRVGGPEDLARIGREAWPCDALLLDAKARGGALGGTGQSFDWGLLEGWTRPQTLVLAGGLHPGNVAEAVRRVRPDWVDAASGVELAPGRKSMEKMKSFVEAAKGAGP